MSHFIHFYAAANFTGVGHNLGTMVKDIGGVATLAVGGLRALGHYAAHRMGALMGTVIVAAVVGMFFFDTQGVTNVLTGTAHTVLK